MRQQQLQMLFLLLLTTLLFSACKNYYMAADSNHKPATRSFDSLGKESRYFILRSGGLAYAMNNVAIDNNQQLMSYTVDTLARWHLLHLKKGYGKMQYKKTNPMDYNVLNEVHVYVPEPKTMSMGETYSLPIDSIQKIEVLIHDKKRTRRSKELGVAAGVGVASIGLLVSVAVAMSQWKF